MDQFFKEFSCSQEKDLIWVSKLTVDIPTPGKLILVQIYPCVQMKNHHSEAALVSTGIIPLLSNPYTVNQLIMETDLEYPKGCSF